MKKDTIKTAYHKSNAGDRFSIKEKGLVPQVGESYLSHQPETVEKIGEVSFAILGREVEYDSTYDDDLWEIAYSEDPDSPLYIKWEQDPSFDEHSNVHVYTKQIIPSKQMTQLYFGSNNSVTGDYLCYPQIFSPDDFDRLTLTVGSFTFSALYEKKIDQVRVDRTFYKTTHIADGSEFDFFQYSMKDSECRDYIEILSKIQKWAFLSCDAKLLIVPDNLSPTSLITMKFGKKEGQFYSKSDTNHLAEIKDSENILEDVCRINGLECFAEYYFEIEGDFIVVKEARHNNAEDDEKVFSTSIKDFNEKSKYVIIIEGEEIPSIESVLGDSILEKETISTKRSV